METFLFLVMLVGIKEVSGGDADSLGTGAITHKTPRHDIAGVIPAGGQSGLNINTPEEFERVIKEISPRPSRRAHLPPGRVQTQAGEGEKYE